MFLNTQTIICTVLYPTIRILPRFKESMSFFAFFTCVETVFNHTVKSVYVFIQHCSFQDIFAMTSVLILQVLLLGFIRPSTHSFSLFSLVSVLQAFILDLHLGYLIQALSCSHYSEVFHALFTLDMLS